MAKKLVGVRLSDVGVALLAVLQDRTGASQASVVEMGLRELARAQGVTAHDMVVHANKIKADSASKEE